MSSSRTRPTEAEWLQQKPNIKRMIIDQNMSQEEARQRLKDGGLLVSKAQLEYKLKTWGFRKKIPKKKSDDIWQYVGHCIEKRKRQDNKDSDVFLNGRLLDPAKVRKEINRHQPSSLVNFQKAGVSPRTPMSSGMIICTPPATSMQSVSPICLPWLQFQRSLSLSLGFAKNPAASSLAPIKIVAEMEGMFFSSISCVVRNPSGLDSYSLPMGPNLMMPRAHQDDNAGRAQLLPQGPPANVTTETSTLVSYEFLNKLVNLEFESHEWDSIVAWLGESEITRIPLQLDKMVDATLQSVTEILFEKAVRNLEEEYRFNYWYTDLATSSNTDSELRNYGEWDGKWDENILIKLSSWKIIDWLLSSGQNPNIPIWWEGEGLLTPLQMAADSGCTHLILLLLDANSNPALVYDDPDLPIRRFLRHKNTSCAEKIRLLQHLLKPDVSVSFFDDEQQGSSLIGALEGFEINFETVNLELLDILMGNETQVWLKYRTESPFRWITQACSVMGYAAQLSDESTAVGCLLHFLNKARQSYPSLPTNHFITSDVILFAAFRGHLKAFEIFRELRVDVAVHGHRGITALHVAAYFGYLRICQILLELGVPADGPLNSQHLPSPLHLAANRGHPETLELLHSKGAQLARGISLDEQQHWKWTGDAWVDDFDYYQFTKPVKAAILGRNQRVWEFFARQGVKFPPWSAFYAADHSALQRKAVRLALKMGADPNWRGRWGMSALRVALSERHYAAAERTAEIVKIAMDLLDAGAVLLCGEIHKVLWHNDRALTKRLLLVEYFGTSRPHESISVLELAIAVGVFQQIITQVPRIYNAGVLCALVSFWDSNYREIRRLLHIRPQIEDIDPLESLAIGIAAWRGDSYLLHLLLVKFHKPAPAALPEDTMRKLMEGKHDLGRKYPGEPFYDGWKRRLFWRDQRATLGSPLALALMSNWSLSQLLDRGFLPDRLTMSIAVGLGSGACLKKLASYPTLFSGFEDYEGPLTKAVRRKDTASVECLLDGKHHINENNDFVECGRSPLQMAVECGDWGLIKLCLDRGADINAPAARVRGATALQVAAIKGCLDVVKMLVDLGADINAPGAMEGGRTALEGAAEYGRIDTVRFLLYQGVQTVGQGRLSYLRAIEYAEMKGHQAVVQLLKSWRDWTADDD